MSSPAPVIDTSDMDPELARYLNRNYWQQKSVELKTSVTAIVADTKTSTAGLSGNSTTGVQQQMITSRDDEVLMIDMWLFDVFCYTEWAKKTANSSQ